MPYQTVRIPRPIRTSPRLVDRPPPAPVYDDVQVYINPGESVSPAQLMQRAREATAVPQAVPPLTQFATVQWSYPNNWSGYYTWHAQPMTTTDSVAVAPQDALNDWYMAPEVQERMRRLSERILDPSPYLSPRRAPIQCDYEPDVLPLPG